MVVFANPKGIALTFARVQSRTRLRGTLAMVTALGMLSLGVVVGAAPASAGPTPTWTVSGQVQDTGSTAVAGINVSLYSTSDVTTPLGTNATDGTGRYSITGIGDGTYFVSTSGAAGYAANTSANFDVTDADTAAPMLTLTPQGVLSGTVLGYDGTSPIDVFASLYSASDGTWSTVGSTAAVQPDGTFSINAVSSLGEYSLAFEVAYSVPLLTTYFGGLLSAPDPTISPAGIIHATRAQSIGGLDVTMVPAGYITGTATAAGAPAPGVNIDAYDSATDSEYDAQNPTDSAGSYEIKVPANTPLQVETDGAPPYEYQTWDGHNGGCGCTFDAVTVTPGVTKTGINFNLIGATDPVLIIALPLIDDSGTPEPLTGAVALYRQVTGGYKLVDSETTDSTTGAVDFSVPTGGTMHLRIAVIDPTTHKEVWLPIEAYELFDPNDLSNPIEYSPPSPTVCTVPLGNLRPGDERAVLIEVTEDTTQCGPEPAVAHPSNPVGRAGSSSVTTVEASTAAPTPAPTDTATPTPSASPIVTPAPTPSSADTLAPSGGLPWWVWLLIVVGILLLVAVGIVIFRIRS
jgi:hypothetical protein